MVDARAEGRGGWNTCITCSIFVIKCIEIGIVSYLSQDGLVNLHEIRLHTHDIYLPYRAKHFDENHSSFRGHSSLFHLHRCIQNDSPSFERYLCAVSRFRRQSNIAETAEKFIYFFESAWKYFILISSRACKQNRSRWTCIV